MLQNIRDNIQGTVAKVIIAIIIVPFAIFGIESLIGSGGSVDVAKVNGEKVSESELQQAISVQKRQLLAMLGDNAQPSMLDDATLRGPALENLITQHLLQQTATDLKLRVSNQAVDQTIVSMNAFQDNGKFSAERYQMLLRNQGYSPAIFKQMLQQELLVNQLHSGVADSDFVTDKELQTVAALLQQQRTFHYVVIPVSGLADGQPITDADEQAYYQAHGDQFMQEERIRLEYIELKASDFAKPIDDAALKAEYDREMADFKPVTERHAAHILIEANPPLNDEQTKALAESIAKRAAAGEDFAKLAAQYSDDVGSKNNGGDLGTTKGDAFPPVFEQALATLKSGEVSAPVKSEAGYHIIKLIESTTTERPTFEQRKADIAQQLQQNGAQPELQKAVEKLRDQVFNAENLATPAQALNLPVHESKWLDRKTTEPLFANPKVIAAAFSTEVLKDGNNSEVMELAPDHYVVLRIKEHQSAAPKPLTDVRNDVIAAIKKERATIAANKAAGELSTALKNGESFDTLAAQHGYSVKSVEKATRNNAVAPSEVLRSAFALGRPVADKPAPAQTVAINNGDIALVQLLAVTEGAPDSLTDVQRNALRSQLQQSFGASGFAALMDSIKARAEIKRH